MQTRSIAFALLVSFAPATFVAPAVAQGTADDASTLAARARFREGIAAYDSGDFEAARASFLQAYALRRHPDVLLNLAWSCLKSGHPTDADKFFQQFLHEAQNAAPAKRAEAEKGLAEARTKIARIDVIATAGTEVWLDGERLGTAPLAESLVTVEPGAHTVKFKHGDGTTETSSVTAISGEKVIARPANKPTADEEPAPKPAKKSAPKSEPAPKPEPAPEEPAPEASASTTPEEVPAEHHAKKHHRRHSGGIFDLDPAWPFFALAGGALGAVGTGVGFIIARGTANNNASHAVSLINAQHLVSSTPICSNTGLLNATPGLPTACNALISDQNAANTDKTVAIIAFSAGGAFALAAAAYALVGPKAETSTASPSTTSFKVTPLVSPGYSGLSFDGTF